MAKKPERRELFCSFCGERTPYKLIAGPAIDICHECVARTVEVAGPGDTVAQPSPGLHVVPGAHGIGLFGLFRLRVGRVVPTCSFCGKAPPELIQPPTTLGTHGLVCRECLALCQDIVAERARVSPNG
jgi:ATP-dependent protease Clp ATPase subunit